MNAIHAKSSPATDLPEADDEEFLSDLGSRVRKLREQRGMARKVLARNAQVSERYLAQLELGEGNMSIVLLRRIATALGATLIELLDTRERSVEQRLLMRLLDRVPGAQRDEVTTRLISELGFEKDARRQRVALIGLRGAGKSTLGQLLADELGCPFVELDKEVEREAGTSLSEVFLLYGQSGYRRIERRCLERIIATHERAVISAGGGVVSEAETYELLLAKCFTVWVKAAPEEHMARVEAQGDMRPMQGNDEAMEDLRRILIAREPLYGRADCIVDTSHRSIKASLTSLRRAVAE
jgi:XRE family transcriptional regulator, aerobic/anaerobic benzoate catabolism transcriptional regulator